MKQVLIDYISGVAGGIAVVLVVRRAKNNTNNHIYQRN
jgi:hypothetical protein